MVEEDGGFGNGRRAGKTWVGERRLDQCPIRRWGAGRIANPSSQPQLASSCQPTPSHLSPPSLSSSLPSHDNIILILKHHSSPHALVC